MFALAIIIGVYSYLVMGLGILGFLYKVNIIVLTIVYIAIAMYLNTDLLKQKILQCYKVLNKFSKSSKSKFFFKLEQQDTTIALLIPLFILQAVVNLIGVVGPEVAFDALWYHLTLPKIYLLNHSINFIPGGLLYYSAMPKLIEMFYIPALAFDSEALAKFIHFSFGILSSIALYKLSRKLFPPKISLIAVVVFYSNLVVAWQSTTAYVDLARTFFEIMALWAFVNFWKKGEKKWLIESAVMLGLAISAKLLALGSLFIFSALIGIHSFTSEESKSLLRHHPRWLSRLKRLSINTLVYSCISILIPLPWFVFSYIHTGNPLYPFFTNIYRVGFNIELLNPFRLIREVWTIFMESFDPVSPIYMIFLPLIILTFFRRLRDSGFARMTPIKIITIYSIFALIVWYLTPRTGGGRFIMPYLPAFSIVAAAVIEKTKDKSLRTVLIGVVITVSVISIVYRGIANSRYIPVIIGKQSKTGFLTHHLNFSFGDFYDTEGYFKRHIKPSDRVLLYGFHNLFYVDFPFIDSSWVKKGDSFNYVAVQNADLPKRFSNWSLVYYNQKTNVRLYSTGGIKWTY